MHFFNFLKKFFEYFRKFSGVRGGLRPRTPNETGPLKCSSPEPKSWRRRCQQSKATPDTIYLSGQHIKYIANPTMKRKRKAQKLISEKEKRNFFAGRRKDKRKCVPVCACERICIDVMSSSKQALCIDKVCERGECASGQEAGTTIQCEVMHKQTYYEFTSTFLKFQRHC